MTEADWLASTNAGSMLLHLIECDRRDARKARLSAIACCRRVWDHLSVDEVREAVELSRRYAEEQATDDDLFRQHNRAPAALRSLATLGREAEAVLVVGLLTWVLFPTNGSAGTAPEKAVALLGNAYRNGHLLRSDQWFGNDDWWQREADAAMHAERVAQAVVFRDVFGNPFRPLPAIRRGGAGWEVVRRIAESAYLEEDARDFLVLADAVEDADCDAPELLSHLRSPGPHVRGCWAIDLILGRGASLVRGCNDQGVFDPF